ncbi:T6SS immunity protein Tdi1 domain-containing protein [Bacillus cereus group sp. BfR-BA-01380]|uniref:T6SS immunity protein Tdi1 domain-containing protein n=1 Tax=Bacillus cereus group sp. BfR-BA-01380 TaxID=2920324 RepID=UPI001F5864D8|nr:T6SS immunity protein Tdi1 domain-containing protein [Bacillus cereus group sp. BfR-BA-01380]
MGDFILEKKVSKDIVEKYSDRLPKSLINMWQEYGFGRILNGYLRLINPDDYFEIVQETYIRNQNTIPLFTTGMGDIILFENYGDKSYMIQLNYRKGKSKVIASKFNLFLKFLGEEEYLEEDMEWESYLEAVQKYGSPTYGECFGYTPILGLGGSEKVGNLKKVKLIEYIYLITQLMGPIK